MASPGQLPDFDELWDYGDPAGTEAAFRELFESTESSGDHSYHLQLLTQLARTAGLQQRFDEAHRILDKVESALRPGMNTALVRYRLERGRAFNSAGSKIQARELFLDAYRLGRRTRQDFFAVDAAHMMGIVEKGEEALRWNETALELAEQSSDERARGWAGSLYNNIGWTYHDMGCYEGALKLFEKALLFQKNEGDKGKIFIARWCVARCLRSMGMVERSLGIQRDLQREADLAGEKDGYVYEELGEGLLELGLPGEAAPWFHLAWEELSGDEWLVSNEPERLERLKELGRE